jgi:hypothetical protein
MTAILARFAIWLSAIREFLFGSDPPTPNTIATAPPKPAVQTVRTSQFPFTSDPLGGLVSHLTTKCGGNVHDKGAVEITASSVDGDNRPLNAADLGDTHSSYFSQNEPGAWIDWDFKALRIEPTHYTIWAYVSGHYLKNWAVDGSADGASWTEIDRRENNSDLNDEYAVETFAVARSGSFRMIRLLMTGPNHDGANYLFLRAFELFGAFAGLQ